MDQTPEQQRDAAVAELARLRAGLTVGLTPDQSARLRGSTPEEIEADARAFAADLGAGAPPPPRVGGVRGVDVGNGAGTVAGGAERYRQRHPQREPRPLATDQESRRNPWAEPAYTMENR
ncbi:hypothetical protein [Streptomyces buecherae]|uniref:hypothetical protein n=1 Tax=Streptomyces buecherae TaxID=2763006 RepID=UPI0037A1023A